MIAEYDGAGNLLSEYVYANGQRIAKMDPDGTMDYYLNDHLGSARAMAGSGWSANYYPFGEIASQTGSEEDTHFDFIGQERDRETGLMYFGARYYRSKAEIPFLWDNPAIGRFLTVDPCDYKYPSWSSYNYCGNNPLKYIDPTGMLWETKDDEDLAKKAINKLQDRQKKLEAEEKKLNSKIVKATQNGDTDKVTKLSNELSDVTQQRNDVISAQDEIKAIGDDKNTTFTFNSLGRNSYEGGLKISKTGSVVINYVHGDFGNRVHELKHAAQVQQGLLKVRGRDLWSTTQLSFLGAEVQAHQRQFSVTGKLPKSDAGNPKRFNEINTAYVKGIYYNVGNYGFKHYPYKDYK